MSADRNTLDTVEKFYIWAENMLSRAYTAEKKYGFREWTTHEDVVFPDGSKLQTGTYTSPYSDKSWPEYLDEMVTHYYLTDRTSSGYSRDSVELPRAVGEALAKVWKQNQYRSFIGVRTVASILKLLGNGLLASDLVARGKARADLERRITEVNRRNSARAEISRQAAALRDLIVRSAINERGEAAAADLSAITLGELIALVEANEAIPSL